MTCFQNLNKKMFLQSIFRRSFVPAFISIVSSLMFFSCESIFDEYPDDNVFTPNGGKLAIQIRIKHVGESNTRAGDEIIDGNLVDGDHNEHKIGASGNFAIFFDENKKLYSLTQLTYDKEEHPDDDVIESIYYASIDPSAYETLPKYCLIILNGQKYFDTFSSYNSNKTVDDILAEVWEDVDNPRSIGFSSEGNLTMTNSIYFDEKGEKQTVVELSEDMIYVVGNAESKANAKILTVYVERMLGKFSLNVPGKETDENGYYIYDLKGQSLVVFNGFDEDSGSPKYVNRDWRIAVTGYSVNALEKSSYLFKNVKDTTYFKNWVWKDPSAFRTYWSQDRHNAGNYPWQYRNAVDYSLNYYEDFENKNINLLRNFSYNELGLDKPNFDKSVYVPENTYNYEKIKGTLDNREDLLAGTHLIIGARMQMKNASGGYENQDFYRDRDGYCYLNQKDLFKSVVYAMDAALTSQDQMKFTFYNWGNGNNTTSKQGEMLYARAKGEFNLYLNHELITNDLIDGYGNDFLALATIKSGDGRRLPWPKTGTLTVEGDSPNIEIFDENGRKVRNATEDDIKSLIYEWIGVFDHFNEGRMYYVAPATILEKAGDSGNNICGVVRNGWYYYNLLNVEKIGTPVDDVDQPIIPDPIEGNDQINFTLKILDWHIETVTAEILPK